MANAEVKKAAASKKFDPASLSYEEAGLVLENFLGVHPKYFIYESGQIKLNQWAMVADKIFFNGFLPHQIERGFVKEEDYKKRFKK